MQAAEISLTESDLMKADVLRNAVVTTRPRISYDQTTNTVYATSRTQQALGETKIRNFYCKYHVPSPLRLGGEAVVVENVARFATEKLEASIVNALGTSAPSVPEDAVNVTVTPDALGDLVTAQTYLHEAPAAHSVDFGQQEMRVLIAPPNDALVFRSNPIQLPTSGTYTWDYGAYDGSVEYLRGFATTDTLLQVHHPTIGATTSATGHFQWGTLNYMYGTYNLGASMEVFSYSGDSVDRGELPLRLRIRNNLRGSKSGRGLLLSATPSIEEMKARETLRDILSEAEWRRYCTNGFVMVRGSKDFVNPKGAAGPFWYQIFSDQRHTVVFKDGDKVGSLCIHTDGKCPPSDHVINLKLLVEMDEHQIWAGANLRQPELRALIA